MICLLWFRIAEPSTPRQRGARGGQAEETVGDLRPWARAGKKRANKNRRLLPIVFRACRVAT